MQRVKHFSHRFVSSGLISWQNNLSYLKCDQGSFLSQSLWQKNLPFSVLQLTESEICWTKGISPDSCTLKCTPNSQRKEDSLGFITFIYRLSLSHTFVLLMAALVGCWNMHWIMFLLWSVWKSTTQFCKHSLNSPLKPWILWCSPSVSWRLI